MKQQIEDVIGLPADDAVMISAKTGLNIEGVLEALVTRLPPPKGDADAPLKALLVDSWYDQYLGVVILVRIKDGRIKRGMKDPHDVQRRGAPGRAGRRVHAQDGADRGSRARRDGLHHRRHQDGGGLQRGRHHHRRPHPGRRGAARVQAVHPVVWCGLFPVDADDFEKLRESLGKLRLNDASFHFEAETSAALGFGYRCGFLGLLHLEIIQERLSRFDLDLIATAPSVVYQIHRNDGTMELLHNPADMPDPTYIDHIDEPWIKATIMVPDEYLGAILTLCSERRGQQVDLTYVGGRAMAVYRLPLNEVVFDFYDRLKSISRGYASFDYAMDGYMESDLVRISILVNQDPVDALSFIAHRSAAEQRGRAICAKLKDLIPRQLFKIAIQAAIGGRVIARETIGALSKDVTAKCYGGDISRKRKLLEKQKEGKKRMRQFGKVEIPQSAFLAALKMDA